LIGATSPWPNLSHSGSHLSTTGQLFALAGSSPIDDFDELYGWARQRSVIEYLLEIAPPTDPNRVLEHHLWRMGWFDSRWRELDPLRALFEAGLRWTNRSMEAAAGLRRILLGLSNEMFIESAAAGVLGPGPRRPASPPPAPACPTARCARNPRDFGPTGRPKRT
jgi:hypothetical protein